MFTAKNDNHRCGVGILLLNRQKKQISSLVYSLVELQMS